MAAVPRGDRDRVQAGKVKTGDTAAIQTPPGHVLAAITARETPGVTSIAIDDVGLDTALRRATAATRT